MSEPSNKPTLMKKLIGYALNFMTYTDAERGQLTDVDYVLAMVTQLGIGAAVGAIYGHGRGLAGQSVLPWKKEPVKSVVLA